MVAVAAVIHSLVAAAVACGSDTSLSGGEDNDARWKLTLKGVWVMDRTLKDPHSQKALKSENRADF